MDKSLKQEPADNSKKRKSPQVCTDSPPPSPLSQTLELNPNDDDSITTSTESSDIFETWTLVMDKQKLQDENRVEIVKDNEHHQQDVEDEEVEESEQDKDKELHDSSNDVTTDDLSDGISIISESESNGRVSPHPYLRDHLQDLTLRFATAQHDDDEILHKLRQETEETDRPYPMPVIVSEQQQIRQRTARRSFNESQDNKDGALQQTSSQTIMEHHDMPPLLKRGLQGIFYIGVALAILGVIGKIRNPTWQPLAASNNPSAADIVQKINDMELQNNLMRAEIDLLNKQVKYLNNINEPEQQKKSGKHKGHYEEPGNYREGKTFRAWSGNGDTLRPVEITKDDLKRPYKCPDGSFTEFAGMCVEKQRNEPNIVEQFEQVVDDFKQQSDTMQTFEKVAQELHGFTESPFEQVQQFLKENDKQQPEQQQDTVSKLNQDKLKNKPIYQPHYDSKQHPSEAGDFQQNPSSLPSQEKGKHRSHETLLERNQRICEEYKRFKLKHGLDEKPFKFVSRGGEEEEAKERILKRLNESKERYQKRNDDSKERHRNKRNDDDSNERYRKRNDDSKERFNKGSKESNSKERIKKQKPHDDGEWQENYMKHRENLRKENEQKYYGDNKNWYIKRGDSRENKRIIDDIRHR